MRIRTGMVVLGLFLSPSAAHSARKDKPKRVVEEPATWEKPGGREQARLEFAEALLASGSADACLELIAQLRRDGVRGLELERLHAKALSATGLDDDARTILESAIRRWPRDGALHNALGISYMDRNATSDALRHFEKAVQYDRENADYLNNLGFALMVDGRPGDAIAVLRSALRADSSKAQTRNNLGFALVAAGQEEEAWRVFKAATRSPADAHYNVGVGLELRGESSSATSAYERALDIDPQHTPARDALVRLQSSSSDDTVPRPDSASQTSEP